MATMADLVTLVRNETAASTTVLPTATLEEFLNTAMRRLNRAHPFRELQQSLTVPYVAGLDGVALPMDFLYEAGVWIQTQQTDPSVALTVCVKTQRRFWIEAVDPSNLTDQVFPNVAAPGPVTFATQNYYLWANKLYLVPQPTSPTTLLIDYVQRLRDLTGTLTNALFDEFPDLLRAAASARAYRYLHEPELAADCEAEYQEALRQAILADDTLAMSGGPKARGV